MTAQTKPSRIRTRTLKRRTLIIGITVELIFAAIMGMTAGARGLGTFFPQLNLVAKPFVCPDGTMTSGQSRSEVGTATEWRGRWFCTDEQSGIKTELNSDIVMLYASPPYILVFFALFLGITYLYWYSSVGPAKNDGLHLW